MEGIELTPDAWRGRCLNLYARAEHAVGLALEAAHRSGCVDRLRHLAGQRLVDLIEIVEKQGGTGKQVRAFSAALDAWQSVEPKRQFLAHGVESISEDARGSWILLLDVVVYRRNLAERHRWAIKQSEALDFLLELDKAFKQLSGQLGHFRKRTQDQPR